MGTQEVFVLIASVMLVGCMMSRSLREAFVQGLDEFRDRWGGGGRGGPRPMHPLPADDGRLLRKRRRDKIGSVRQDK